MSVKKNLEKFEAWLKDDTTIELDDELTDFAWYVWKAAHAESAARIAELEQNIKDFRHLLFLEHGSKTHYLYGDDGERHCNTCMIDFNVDSPEIIRQKLEGYAMKEYAKAQATTNTGDKT